MMMHIKTEKGIFTTSQMKSTKVQTLGALYHELVIELVQSVPVLVRLYTLHHELVNYLSVCIY